MAAIIKFDQSGKPAGVNNRSRSDITAGTAVTITNVSPGTVNSCELLAKPTADDTAAISGTSPTYSITPKAGTYGTYRIRLTVDGDIVVHTFTVKSPRRALQVNSHNERASADANLADTDPGTWVNESETNEGGHYKGWYPGGYEETLDKLEWSVAAPSTSKIYEKAVFNDVNGIAIIGSGLREYPPSTTNPTVPTPLHGDRYFNTTLSMWLYYDSTRTKWLSEQLCSFSFGYSGICSSGSYYRSPGGVIFSSTNGNLAPMNGTVVCIEYTRDDTDLAYFEAVANGTTVASLTSTAIAGRTTALNGDFSVDQVISMRNGAAGNAVTNATGNYGVRWRV